MRSLDAAGTLMDPQAWSRAFNEIPHGYKWAAIGLLVLWIYALIQKWKPREKGRLPG